MPSMRDKKGRPIVVATGLGIVTSLGVGKGENWGKLIAGESGIHPITRFATENLKTRIAGTVDFVPVEPVSAPSLSERFGELAAARLSSTMAPAPSAMTKPSRFLENGRAAACGGSFVVESAESSENRIKDSGLTEPSVPIASAASVSPRRIASTPSWIAVAPDAQAVETDIGEPLVPNFSAR